MLQYDSSRMTLSDSRSKRTKLSRRLDWSDKRLNWFLQSYRQFDRSLCEFYRDLKQINRSSRQSNRSFLYLNDRGRQHSIRH